MKDALELERAGADAGAVRGEEHVRKERFFELLSSPSPRRATILGVVGAAVFFGIWEVGHYLTPESGTRFLPAVEQVVGRIGLRTSFSSRIPMRPSTVPETSCWTTSRKDLKTFDFCGPVGRRSQRRSVASSIITMRRITKLGLFIIIFFDQDAPGFSRPE